MANLPVIVGYGGINAAGRSSFHQMYNRLVIDSISDSHAQQTYAGLALMMNLVTYRNGNYLSSDGSVLQPGEIMKVMGKNIRDNTLVRRIEAELFNVDSLPFNSPSTLAPGNDSPVTFLMRNDQLPAPLPDGWHLSALDDHLVRVSILDNQEIMVQGKRGHKVQTAAQMPSGFNPGMKYRSRNHPRGLQMAVYAASDAIQSIGIPWEEVLNHVAPDKISVYAGSLMGQMDDYSFGGMLKGWLTGQELTSTQLSLGLTSMCTDFISSYVLSNLGSTGSHQGACASFLYNLEHAIQDIQQGKSRVAVVGSAEAPITPEVVEGFRAMGALAEVEKLMALDKRLSAAEVDHSKASRPFNYNCGFTIAESAQYVVLFDDKLVLELGASILGSVPDVYINADGNKKSITAPGVGNYITMAKAAASVRSLLGDSVLRNRTFVQAHGSSTPLNRTTESHVLDSVAKAFSIQSWPVTAVKAYLGHSLASAAGDQLAATLGVWQQGWIPGIFTLDQIAEDVYSERLELFRLHKYVGCNGMDAAFINSKGFGGNNATAVVLAPDLTRRMLEQRHGKSSFSAYDKANETTREQAEHYNQTALIGLDEPIYRFGESVLEGHELTLTDSSLTVPGYQNPIRFSCQSPYSDMVK